MTNPVSAASKIVVKTDALFKEHRKFLSLFKALGKSEKFEIDPKLIRHKYQRWLNSWFKNEQLLDDFSLGLWGTQGVKNVRDILGIIVDAGVKYEACLAKEIPTFDSSLSVNQHRSKLAGYAAELHDAVDALCIYSESVFRSLHGVECPKFAMAPRETLLTLALRSRVELLQLFRWYAKSGYVCSLGLELLDTEIRPSASSTSSHRKKCRSPFTLSVELFNHLDSFSLDSIQEFAIIIVTKKDASGTEERTTIYGDSHKPKLVETRHKYNVESFVAILDKSHPKTEDLSGKKHFSLDAKFDLAYNIVETGFFLLGTPWLTKLNSSTTLRLQHRKLHPTPKYVLLLSSSDLNELLCDDPYALEETAQLFQIGILLVEIALHKIRIPTSVDTRGPELDMIRLLSEVEREMGSEYCKATAFCLHYRQPNPLFLGEEKYRGPLSNKCQHYLDELLKDYYSQVLLRCVACASDTCLTDARTDFKDCGESFLVERIYHKGPLLVLARWARPMFSFRTRSGIERAVISNNRTDFQQLNQVHCSYD